MDSITVLAYALCVFLIWLVTYRLCSTLIIRLRRQRGQKQGTIPLYSQAEENAFSLLEPFLSAQDKAHLLTYGIIEVRSKLHRGCIYRIHAYKEAFSISALKGNKLIGELCVDFNYDSRTNLPWPDIVLAHKLNLEGNEAEYLKKANKKANKQPHCEVWHW